MEIYGFSLIRIFPHISLDSAHIRENVAQRKPLYLHILCSLQLNLSINFGTTFFYLQNSALETLSLLHYHFAVHFFLQPQITVYISGSVTIHLSGSNTESTEFLPNSTGFELVSGADIISEEIKSK